MSRQKIFIVVGIVIVLVVALGGAAYLTLMPVPRQLVPAPDVPREVLPEALQEPVDVVDRPLPDIPAEIEVKEGRARIKSEDADGDAEQLRLFVQEYNGYIEESQKTETLTLIRIGSTVRVPTENFDELLKDIQANFDVRTYNTSDFRITIEHQLDELDVIQRTLEDYTEIREEARQLRVDEERIRLLMSITNKETELVRRQRTIERELAVKQRQAEMATLAVSIEQKLPSKLWPEELGARFLERLSWMIDSIATAFIGITTNSLVVLVKVIEYIIYAIIVIVPVAIVWRVGRRIYRRFFEHE